MKILTDPKLVGSFADQMIGDILVTKQTGPSGQLCQKVLVNEGINILPNEEKYFAILMDRKYASLPLFIPIISNLLV